VRWDRGFGSFRTAQNSAHSPEWRRQDDDCPNPGAGLSSAQKGQCSSWIVIFAKVKWPKQSAQNNHKDLSPVLSGAIHISRASLAVQPNLWVLPAGAVPSDPLAMLASREVATLL
jgi:hypothetical protein